jgi:hypothetical protein
MPAFASKFAAQPLSFSFAGSYYDFVVGGIGNDFLYGAVRARTASADCVPYKVPATLDCIPLT